jgi:hypothetical protein
MNADGDASDENLLLTEEHETLVVAKLKESVLS